MRYAIWSAVSTKSQARDDKVSLAEQEGKCRSAGETRGWVETSGPYIVPGATRSFYVNLSDAEKDIPPLRQMLEDARNDKFDVLVIYTYDRLGDLVDMIAQSLRFYGKQIFSVSQPVEPQDPGHFDPYAAEAEAIMRDAARITQRFRINDLRRKNRAGMPIRVQMGLNPKKVPFGYKYTTKKEPPAIVPEHAALVIRMKDMLLRGGSIRSICQYANKTGIAPSGGGNHWDAKSVTYILTNPFYAGVVAINKFVTQRDPRSKNQQVLARLPKSKWTMNKGLHQPLWDEETWMALVDELERRRQMNIRCGSKYALSGLMSCSQCGQRLYRSTTSSGKFRRPVLSCDFRYVKPPHHRLEIEPTLDKVFADFSDHIAELRLKKETHKTDRSVYEDAIRDLTAQRKRIQEGFKVGIFDQAEATQAINGIDSQVEDLKLKMEEGETLARSRQEFLRDLPPMDKFPTWLKTEDPAFVRRLLIAFLEKIIVHPGGSFEYKWRE